MKNYLIIISLAISFLACEKEDESPKLSEKNDFEVTINPFTLKGAEATQIPIDIYSSETGFSIDLFLRATHDGIGYGYTIEQDVIPNFYVNNQRYLGVKKTIQINKNDITVMLEMTPKNIYNRDDKMPISVYIKGNNSKTTNYDANLGVEYASTYCSMSFDAPTIEKLTISEKEVTSNSVELSIDEFRLTTNVVSKITHGFCYSNSKNPTINDMQYSNVSYDYINTNEVLKTFNRGENVLINDLNPNTTYYFRPFAQNSKTTYGEEFEITTLVSCHV
jgi:hypothetical protein